MFFPTEEVGECPRMKKKKSATATNQNKESPDKNKSIHPQSSKCV